MDVHWHNFYILDIASAFAAANRVRNMRPSIEDDTTSIAEELPLDSEKALGVTIEFSNVSFKYPTRDVAVLEQLNMSVSLDRFTKKT